MTDQERIRYQAWIDGLEHEEREFAERGDGMPVEMAGVYATVELRREIKADFDAFRSELRQELEALRRPWWRQALAPLAAVSAAIAALLTPDVPRP